MAVRLSADWMGQVDDRILEYLESEGPVSPGKMAESDKIRFSRDYVNRRLILLRKANLVEMIGNGVYSLSSKGQEYLAGVADLRDEPEPE